MGNVQQGAGGLPDFDPDALRQKYRTERDKRLRQDGIEQYVDLSGRFAHYLDDPHAEPGFTRKPVFDSVDVLVLGGGFTGLQVAGRLRKQGVSKIRIVEKGGDFGGTWYWNRYPGALCDVESYIYLPYLEELNYVPSMKYVGAPEILEHSRAIARHFDLYKDALLQTEVKSFEWNEDTGLWTVSTDRGDAFTARFICLGTGPLSRPRLPGIPGIETFTGHAFHTSRWDYEYTGGDWSGNLTNLVDKRVGIIGTSSTAIQCIPHLGEWSKQLYVFQRTPSGVDVRNNQPTDPEWAKSLKPGWQRERMENFESLIMGKPQEVDLVADGWTDLMRMVALWANDDLKKSTDPAKIGEVMQLADFKKMDQIRQRVDDIVKDPATAEALKPWYNRWCKRPCFHDQYLPTFNRPNVTLVDTNGKGVDRIDGNKVIVGDQSYEVDCLVYASGFEINNGFTHRIACDLVGRDGLKLSQRWAHEPMTFMGLMTDHFPNAFFFVSSLKGAATFNYPYMTDVEGERIAKLIRDTMDSGIKSIEITAEAVDAWDELVQRKQAFPKEFFRECTPGAYNGEGKVENARAFMDAYGEGPFAFTEMLDEWLAEGYKRNLVMKRW